MPQKFILRSSMKALEDNLRQHGLIRCHRSYFVNPSFIRIIHRNDAGLIESVHVAAFEFEDFFVTLTKFLCL